MAGAIQRYGSGVVNLSLTEGGFALVPVSRIDAVWLKTDGVTGELATMLRCGGVTYDVDHAISDVCEAIGWVEPGEL